MITCLLKYRDKICRVILFTTLFCIILHTDKLFFDRYIYSKWIFLFVGAAALIFLYTIKIQCFKLRINKIGIFITVTSLIWLVKLVIELSTDKIFVLVSFLIYYHFFYNIVRKNIRINRVFILLLCITGLILSISALVQYINGSYLICGTYDNPAGLTLTLACITPFIILTIKKSQYLFIKILLFSFIFMNGLVIYLSTSRIGIISYLFVIIYPLFKQHKYILITLLSVIFILLTLYCKSQSSMGRIFIYKTSLTMIKPTTLLIGKGSGAFKREYMEFQAKQFENNKNNEKYALLAGNTLHPLNEFLLFVIEHGILFLFTALFLISYLFKNKWQNKATFCSFIVILIFSLFSYPFKYPITIFILAYCLAYCNDENNKNYEIVLPSAFRYIFICISICGICYLVTDIHHNILWKKYSTKTELGKYDEANDGYKKIYPHMKYNLDFMYNYAANRYNAKDYGECIKLLKQIILLSDNYDVQLLTAQTYENLQQDSLSITHYKKAAQMCPNRFIPLYGIFRIYDRRGDISLRDQLGVKILEKPIKIDSYAIREIRESVSKIIDK